MPGFTQALREFVWRHRLLCQAGKIIRGDQIVLLKYPIRPTPRYGHGKPPHPALYDIINGNREVYRQTLESFLCFGEHLRQIPVMEPNSPQGPCWINGWLPGLDAAALYSLLCLRNPERYFEVGSGFSTRFARTAVRDHGLRTKITSIDPRPRAAIDSICDAVIRQPLEEVDVTLFDELHAGDILYIDGSHRCFTNSDVTVAFLDILPRLRAGVLVELHDIFLPYDYPPGWEDHYYSEQYMLAAFLLGGGDRKLRVVLPNCFITYDPVLGRILDPLWDHPALRGAQRHGDSFWLEITECEYPKTR